MTTDPRHTAAPTSSTVQPIARRANRSRPVSVAVVEPEALEVIHVVRQFAPGVGGMEDFVKQLALRQLAAGMTVRVVTLDRLFDDPEERQLPSAEVIDSIPVARLRWFGSKRYPIAPAVLGAIGKADLVHVHGVDFFCDFLAATRFWHGRRMVLSTHGGFFHTGYAKRAKRMFFQVVTRRSLRSFAAVIPSSLQDETQFRDIRPGGLQTVENGVDLAKFDDCADPAARTMIYFGRLAPNKGLERLLAWFALAHGIDPRWRLIIAGRAMGSDPEALAALAASQGIASSVEIHAWPHDDALRSLIGRSSVYACASEYEGFGLAAVEAMSAGLYPLLSDIPAFRRTVERAGYGALTRFELDATSVGRALAAVEEGLSGAPGPVERRHRLAQFGWEGAAEAIRQIYLRALGRSRRRIGKVDISVLNQDRVIGLVDRAVAAREPLFVAFCNAHTANTAETNPAFAAAIGRAVVVNDGTGVDIASKLLFGRPFAENLAGTDLVDELLERASGPLRVFLLGSAPGVASEAAERLAALYPRHRFVGSADGFFTEADEPQLLARIRASEANILLVGMGHPRQEIWSAAHFRDLGIVALAVGAYMDFAAGVVTRAPAWVRQCRSEWVYRLMLEPRRLARRYLIGNFAFLGRLFLQWRSGARI